MRPKHVASLGTVLMGVAVSALTIGFIAAVSRDAREWFRQGSRLLAQRDDLQKSVDLQKAQLGGLNDTILDNQSQIRREQIAILDGQKRIQSLNGDLREKDGALRATNAQLEKTKADLSVRQAQLKAQRRQLVALQKGVEAARGQVRTANHTLLAVNRRLTVAQADLDRSLAELKTAQNDTAVANANVKQALVTSIKTYQENLKLDADLKEEVKNRVALVDSLKAEAAGLVAQRDVAQAQADDAQARYTAIRTDLDKADQELAQTQAALQSVLNSGFKTSRTEPMTFRRGEEVARIVLPAESNVEASRNALAALLRAARIDAEARGAKGHRGFEAADIVDRKDPQTGETIDADTLKRALVANLAGRTDDLVLVATSSLNAFAGEPVSLDLTAMPNPVVYRRNDTVAETRIDGAQPEAKILAQLSEFVNGPLRQRAQKDRMIPRTGTAAPYGEPSAANVWAVLQSVRRAGRPVRVAGGGRGRHSRRRPPAPGVPRPLSVLAKTVLAVDPGTAKHGMALVRRDADDTIHALWHAIVPPPYLLPKLHEAYAVEPFAPRHRGRGHRLRSRPARPARAPARHGDPRGGRDRHHPPSPRALLGGPSPPGLAPLPSRHPPGAARAGRRLRRPDPRRAGAAMTRR